MFLSDGGDYDSLESVHDQIHGLVGGEGHMGWVSVLDDWRDGEREIESLTVMSEPG